MIVIGGLRAPSVSGCEWRRRFEFLPESSRFFASIASLPLSPPPFLSLSLSLSLSLRLRHTVSMKKWDLMGFEFEREF